MRTLVVFVCLSFIASKASAVLLMYEGFNYPVGERIIGQINTSSTPSQTWGDPGSPTQPAGALDDEVMVEVSVSYPGLQTAVGNSLTLPRMDQSNIARITIPGGGYTYLGPNTSLFFGFTLKMTSKVDVPDATAATTVSQQGDFIAGFTASNGAGGMSGGNVYAGQLRIRREIDASLVQTGKLQLGFHKNNLSDGLNYLQFAPQSFAVGESVLVVGEYQFGTNDVHDDVVRMWLNPVPGQPAPMPSVEVTGGFDVSTASGAAQGAINSFWFRDGNNVLPGPLLVDELRLGTAYADVIPVVTVLSGDHNGDGKVDAADYVVWRDAPNDHGGDPTGYDAWRANFGAGTGSGTSSLQSVPEPASLGVLLVAMALVASRRSRQNLA